MELESHKKVISRPAAEVYDFISDFRNFSHLMPSQVQDYQADANTCSFEIGSIGKIWLEINERIEGKNIRAVSTGKTPFTFSLTLELTPVDAESCNVIARLKPELSPFLAMMARNPLQNFVELLTDKLKEFTESSAVS